MNSEHPMTDRVVYRSLMADNLRWDALQLRDGDIIISAPSKSGLTWTQRLVSLLVFDGPDLPGPLSTVSPWLDQTIRPIEEVVATLDAQQHRRFIKTHTPLDGLVLDDRVSYICVGRDPRDAAVSMLYQSANMNEDRMRILHEAVVPFHERIAPPFAELGHARSPTEEFRDWMEGPNQPPPGIGFTHLKGIGTLANILHQLGTGRVLGSADPTTIAHRHGTHRITSPDETWLALQPFLAPAGITGVADVTWLDCLGIPTVQAVRPASLTLSVSQGKAASYRAAQVSAVMESLEGWHAENVTADLWSATARDLEADLTYDPAQLRHRPGSLYHAGVKLDWMVATTLLTGRRTWVPWTAVLVNVATRDCWEPPMFEMDTTGLASGNCYDEATLHALYEVMERHSVAAAVAGETMFEVPTDDVAGSDSAHLVEMIRDAGDDVDLARIDVWDGYYCFAAELTSATLEVTFGGFGLHHDPNVALSRAITEAAQSRITAISGAREDLPSAIYHRFGRVHTYAKARKTSLRLNRARPTPWRVPDVDSLPELVASAATAVANRSGTEPLAVVCDFADACVPVVKVLAPGLVLSSASPMRTPLQEAE